MDRALNLFPYVGEARYESALIFAENGQIDNAKNELLLTLEIWSDADADHIKANESKLKLAEWMK
jgi:predicted glutamine amidotransferase